MIMRKAIAFSLWIILALLLFQVIYFNRYYDDVPRLEQAIKDLEQKTANQKKEINALKQALTRRHHEAGIEEHARTYYMMHKKDEVLYKYLEI